MRFNLQHRLLASGLAAVVGISGVSAQQDSSRDRNRDSSQTTQQRDTDREGRYQRSQTRDQRGNEYEEATQGYRSHDKRQKHDRNDRSAYQKHSERYDSQRRDAHRRGGQQAQVTPTGWIRVASDTDNDGRFDAVETIYFYDFQQARMNSRRRANQDAQTLTGTQQQQQRWNADSQRRQESVQGEIQNLRHEQLAGMKGKSVLAQLKTQNGRTARVLLGPQSKLQDWNLQDGDQITVHGQRARVNDRPVLLASKIEHDGQQQEVQLPSSRNAKRVKGEILRTRKASFRGHGDCLVAQVELVSGKREIVNLGPVSKVGKLDLQDGDQVSMLVRPARVNGQPAMVAEQIRSGEKSVEIPAKQRTRQQGQQFARRGGNDRSQARDRSSRHQRDRQADGRGARYSERMDQTLDPERRAALGVSLQQQDSGVSIAQIHPGTPAAQSKLKEGDQIIAIDDEQVDSVREVSQAIHRASPDKSVDIQVRRNGKKKTFSIRLAKFADLRDQR